jgi:hypothetical protein
MCKAFTSPCYGSALQPGYRWSGINWPEGAPDPMPAELEAEIPPEFRLF